jgi:membrane fusion protein (multidrug efflux system)
MSTTVIPGKASPFSRRNLILAASVIAGVAVAVMALRWWSVGRFIESTDDAYVRADERRCR